MNSDIIFRKYEAADLPFLKGIFFSNVPFYFKEFEWQDFEEFLASDLHEGCIYEVMVWRGNIIGAGGVAEEEDGSVSMCWGMVDAALHKQGFGKQLLGHRLALCTELYKNVPITISTTQHTAGFFEKYGFYTSGITNDHWASGLHLYKMKQL